MDGSARRRPQHGWTALAVALAANLLALPLLDELHVHALGPAASRPRPAARADDAARDGLTHPFDTEPAAIVLVDRAPPALSLAAILGPEDAARFGRGRVRPRKAELPGDRPADRGGGAAGGVDTWTERRDRASDAALRAQVWSSDAAYRAPRADRGRVATTPEAINRRPEPSYGEREPRAAARDGAPRASRGDATGAGNVGGALPAVATADARAGRDGATIAARADGATARAPEPARVEPGDTAVDVSRRGPAVGDRAVAAASDQRRPDPYDLTPPRAGGSAGGEGVAGPLAASGMVADGWRAPGTAATRWGADTDEERATHASRSDPFFLELFRRLDREVVFPRDLAIDLKSGRVVAAVTLRADGGLHAIELHASSGYRGFDDALLGALRRLGPLGPVPAPLIAGRAQLRVLIPFTFKSSMIR
jgi:TonB family protein